MKHLLEVGAEITLSLDQRVDFWTKRFQKCCKAGMPEMVVACTKRHSSLSNLDNRRQWQDSNRSFRDCVLSEIGPFLPGINIAAELFTGPGIFFSELVKSIPNLYGFELVEGIVSYLKDKLASAGGHTGTLVCAPAHHILRSEEVRAGFKPEELDAVFAFRGFLHQPDEEWGLTLDGVEKVLKPGGLLVVGEFFADDKLPNRKTHTGTQYRTIEQYDNFLGGMERIHKSEICDNDGDPCRVIIWRKKI